LKGAVLIHRGYGRVPLLEVVIIWHGVEWEKEERYEAT
jgi:hypothetical protein